MLLSMGLKQGISRLSPQSGNITRPTYPMEDSHLTVGCSPLCVFILVKYLEFIRYSLSTMQNNSVLREES